MAPRCSRSPWSAAPWHGPWHAPRPSRAGPSLSRAHWGLLREMEKLASSSRVGCVIRAADIPTVDGAGWEDALTSGEEAELVCVGPEDLIRRAGLSPFGVLTEDPAVKVVGSDGMPLQLHVSGFDHFA